MGYNPEYSCGFAAFEIMPIFQNRPALKPFGFQRHQINSHIVAEKEA